MISKIAVNKALAASQLVYVMSSTTSCSKLLKETNDLLFEFLWDYKGNKIKRTEMIAGYQDGGQRMLDIMEFNKSHGYLNIFEMTLNLNGSAFSTFIYLR